MKRLISVVLTLVLGLLLTLADPHEAMAISEEFYGSRNRDYPISRSGLDFLQFRVGNYSNWSSLFAHHITAHPPTTSWNCAEESALTRR